MHRMLRDPEATQQVPGLLLGGQEQPAVTGVLLKFHLTPSGQPLVTYGTLNTRTLIILALMCLSVPPGGGVPGRRPVLGREGQGQAGGGTGLYVGPVQRQTGNSCRPSW